MVAKLSVSKYRRRDAKSRRLGVDIFGTMGDWGSARNFPPGMHGHKGYPRPTDKGRQLNHKQRLMFFYGVKGKYFRKALRKAKASPGDDTLNLLKELESRLDVFLYRSKFAPSIRAAKQLISHGHVLVQKKNSNVESYIDVSSYRVEEGTKVIIKKESRENQAVLLGLKSNNIEVPEYIASNSEGGELFSVLLYHPKSINSVFFPFVVDFGIMQSYYL